MTTFVAQRNAIVQRPMVVHDGGLVISRLEASGELDAGSCAELRGAFASLPNEVRVVLDITRVTFIDSSGLGAMIGGIRLVRERGGQFVICGPTKAISRLFVMTGVQRLVAVVDTLDEAVGRFVAERDE